MKTIIKSLLVAFSVSVFHFATAQAEINPGRRAATVTSFKSSFYTTSQGKINVALDKERGGAVVVRLTNSTGKELFLQRIGKQKQTSRLRLDVSELPDGVYQVAISNGVDTITHGLTITTPQPNVINRLVAVN